MARSQQSVYLQTYLMDAVAEEVAKHGRHNQKSHGRRGSAGASARAAGRAVGGAIRRTPQRMRTNRQLNRQGAPTGRTRTVGLLPADRRQQTQVRMTRGERASTAAVGVGVAALGGVRAGPNLIANAIRGKAWVDTDSARARGAIGKAAGGKTGGKGKTGPLPANVVSQLRSAYRQWLTATGRSDSDEAAREYAAAVLAAANRG